MIAIEINTLPKTPNSIGKASIWHSVRERKKWRQLLFRPQATMHRSPVILQGQIIPKPLKKAKLTLTRCSSREPDLDNLYSSFKFVIDALKFNGFIEDDKPSNIDLKCKWEKAKQKEGKIKIEIEEL